VADGQVPPINSNGNFIIGPTHPAAPETIARPDVPKGRVVSFTMTSTDSIIYHPSLVRDEETFDGGIYSAPTVQGDPSQLIITTSHPGTWTRKARSAGWSTTRSRACMRSGWNGKCSHERRKPRA
jgi:hypothetical protein